MKLPNQDNCSTDQFLNWQGDLITNVDGQEFSGLWFWTPGLYQNGTLVFGSQNLSIFDCACVLNCDSLMIF